MYVYTGQCYAKPDLGVKTRIIFKQHTFHYVVHLLYRCHALGMHKL